MFGGPQADEAPIAPVHGDQQRIHAEGTQINATPARHDQHLVVEQFGVNVAQRILLDEVHLHFADGWVRNMVHLLVQNLLIHIDDLAVIILVPKPANTLKVFAVAQAFVDPQDDQIAIALAGVIDKLQGFVRRDGRVLPAQHDLRV